MKKIERINRSNHSIFLFSGLLFLFMLLLNCLTPYIADDYAYMISFYDQDWIDSVSDIFYSMYAHCFSMNGRVISHAFGQFFMLFPKLIFNLCNALMYTVLMYLLYRIANLRRKGNLLLYIGIAMAFWYYAPAFGQIALWQLGSVNYLWGLLAGILFLCPFLYRFITGKELLPHLWQKIPFCICAILFGMYTEITSFIGIFLSFVLLVLIPLLKKGRFKTWLWFPLVLAAVGYLILLKMPAESAAKQATLSLESLMANFSIATAMLRAYALHLLIAWAIFWILGLAAKISKERLILSALLALGAIIANYMLTVASYYPDRCACTTVMLLILACAMIIAELYQSRSGIVCSCYGAIIAILFTFSLISGTYDIWMTHTGFTARETIIAQSIEEGKTDLTLEIIHPSTKYSAYWGLTDLSTETAHTWPNNYMASYYKVKSILGE